MRYNSKAVSRRRFGILAGSAVAAASLARPAIAQTPPRVVVIGGGAGGATVAHHLKLGDPKLDVTLVEANEVYNSSFFSNLVLGGFRSMASINHTYDGLDNLDVEVVHELASMVDVAKRTVMLRGGSTISYDRLVLSPGIDIKYDSIPGYSRAISNQFPHAYLTSQIGKRQLLAAMNALPSGGVFAMVMPNNPYRCPPGPYERACMIAHFLKTKKPGSKLVILDPKKTFSKQPAFTEAFEKYYKGIIELNLTTDIDDHSIAAFDPKARELTTKAGKKVKFSQANIIPQQRAGVIAQQAGVTQGDWVPVDPDTFKAKADPNIFVVGDATIAAEMPKSAFSANSQAKVVVGALLNELSNKDRFPARFRNTCWSLVAPDDCIKVGANYTPKDGKLDPSGSFVSQRGEDAGLRKQNYAEAIGWYDGIVADMFAKGAKKG